MKKKKPRAGLYAKNGIGMAVAVDSGTKKIAEDYKRNDKISNPDFAGEKKRPR